MISVMVTFILYLNVTDPLKIPLNFIFFNKEFVVKIQNLVENDESQIIIIIVVITIIIHIIIELTHSKTVLENTVEIEP